MKNHFFFRLFSLVFLFPVIAISEEEKKLGYPVTVVEQLPNNNTVLKKKCQFSKDKCECSKSLSYEPQLYCVQMNIDMGRTRYSALTESIMLQLCELQPTTALYSPDGFRVVAGYAVYNVSRDKNGSGVSKWIQLVGPSGLAFSFDFAAGESVGKPMSGLVNETSGRLAMVDAQGWATATDPAFYDYYPGDGSRWRFGAARNAPNYLQFVEHQTADGRMETSQDIGLEILRDGAGRLRQVATPAFLANFVVCGQDAYDLTVYPNDTTCISRTRTSDGFYEVLADAVPEVVWKFRNPSPGIPCDLDVTVEKPGAMPQIWRYQYVDAVRDFTLKFPGGMKEAHLERMEADDGNTSVLRRVEVGPDGKAYWTKELHYETKAFGEVLTRSVRDPGGLNLTQYYDYYATGTIAGLERLSVLEDGSWIRYEYDDARRLMAEIRPWMDSPTNAPNNQCAVTRYGYDLFAAGDFLAYNDQRPRTEIKEICGIEVARTYHAYPTNALGQAQEIEERAAFQGAPYGHASNPRTVKTYYASSAAISLSGRLATITYPGGKTETYGYEYGTFNASTFVFIPDPNGGAWRETVTTSYGANSGVQSMRAARVWDEKGREVLDESYVEDGAAFARIGWTRMSYDRNGKLIETAYSDGRVESVTWGANCCGKESFTADDGTVTVYGYNLLRQKISETKKGFAADGGDDIVTLHEYDLESNLLKTSVTNSASDLGYVEIRNAYDSVGRLTNTFDVLGNATVTSYSADGTVTVTRHACKGDLACSSLCITTVTERYLDGQSRRVLENGVVRQSYAYGVNPNGSQWTLTAQGSFPAVSQSTLASPNFSTLTLIQVPWSLTVSDILGRSVFQEKPGFGGSTLITSNAYDTAGNLVATYQYAASQLLPTPCSLLMAPSLYTYAADGTRLQTALDLNTNGVIDLLGPDRINGSASAYEKDASNNWWKVSRSWVYPDFGLATAITSSVQRVKVTGLGVQQGNDGLLTSLSESIDVRGNVTISSSLINRAVRKVSQVTVSPTSLQPSIQIRINGLLNCSVSATAVTTTYAYDALGRQILSETISGILDGRRVASSTHYNALGQVAYNEDAAGNRMTFTYDSLGRRTAITDALGNITHTAYDADGHAVATWGAAYPVAYEYDVHGRMVAMATTRCTLVSTNLLSLLPVGVALSDTSHPFYPSALDTTKWHYDQPTGLLTKKLYADGVGPAYTYTPHGKLATRVWARGVAPDYSYDASGALNGVDYSDATPDISYSYDRIGRLLVARTYLSDTGETVSSVTNTYSTTTLALVSETQNGNVISRSTDSFGRSSGFSVGSDYAVTYGHDAYGRFACVTSTVNNVVNNWQYTYFPGSDLLADVVHPAYTSQRSYEPHRDLITAVSNLCGSSIISAYDYTIDTLGRRVRRLDIGPGVPSVVFTNSFDYNDRSEVTVAVMGTNEYTYGYDPIGNRLFSTSNAKTNAYASNPLNQYTNIAFGQSPVVTLAYDADGNLLTNGVWEYTWDGENRLVSVSSNDVLLVSNAYDYQGRRIEKTTATEKRTFLYDGWNLVREIIIYPGINKLTNLNVWGSDLSGSIQRSGGVGGLLAVTTLSSNQSSSLKTRFPVYDANGNVTAYLDVTGTPAVSFEYDAFGNTVSLSGAMDDAFTFRFSTKKFDAETGLYYYGYRYYLPGLGWINRDPIAVGGCSQWSCPNKKNFLTEYLFCKNQPVVIFDILGLCDNCPSSTWPLYSPKIRSGGSCGHEYRTTTARQPPGPPNGCGSAGTEWIPDSFLWMVSFTACCNKHDDCYGTCGNSKVGCDRALGQCMSGACENAHLELGTYILCLEMAQSYANGLLVVGGPAFESGQDSNCKWETCCK